MGEERCMLLTPYGQATASNRPAVPPARRSAHQGEGEGKAEGEA